MSNQKLRNGDLTTAHSGGQTRAHVPVPASRECYLLRPVARRTLLINLFAVVIVCIASCNSPVSFGQNAPDFEREVAPILVRRCLECHQKHNPSGNLSLDSAEGLLKGGDSGPVIAANDPDASLLLQRVVAGEMPPLKHGESQQLPSQEVEVLKRWINADGEFPKSRTLDLYERTTDVRGGRDWWSFQPITSPQPPASADGTSPHPIDAFIRKSLVEHKLKPAPTAQSKVLVRRLYWDLLGLPATLGTEDELDRNMKSNPAAWNDLVDELLASPHFGERWARHWLDVARFAETCGYERDQVKPYAWKYRDWVVNAMNSDMPYDQFIREQLAGDEVPNRSESSVIATGFLCLGTWNDEPNDPEDYKYERLEDLVHTTSSAFLGLTTKCARCHDHKFDPIPQVDYYRMASAFWPGPIEPRGRELIGGPSADELGFQNVLGWTDVSRSPSPLHVLKNGERGHPLQLVTAASLSLAPTQFASFVVKPDVRTTGLRLQLADWIASPKNPLTARVIVNRLWQHHFGEGLVRSSNNFGFTGDRPTHPELLDWLASELIRNNWSLKSIHRLILTSETWRQASLHPQQADFEQIDAGNRWLWRANRRRVDAESLRDSFLSSTGELDLSIGGPSFYPTISEDALEGLSRKGSAWTASPEKDQHRRSLYIFMQRSLLPPLMTTFDLCDTTLPCGQRDVTIVAPQALTLLNNEFVHLRAEALAEALLIGISFDSPGNWSLPVTDVWESILGRSPTAEELKVSLEHVERQLQRFRHPPEEASHHAASPEDLFDSLAAESCLMLDASNGMKANPEGLVEAWQDQSDEAHHAKQSELNRCPILVSNAINGQPAVRFNGQSCFMHLDGPVLSTDDVTVFAVITDAATDPASLVHRELLSNWSGRDGNSGSSFFVGMTGEKSIRLSDHISGVGEVQNRHSPFLLTASNGDHGAAVFQQSRPVTSSSSRLPERRLDTPWVIGQQGNIDGEYWNGDVAFLMVINRELSVAERESVQTHLIRRFNLPNTETPSAPARSPEQLALASLCLVLFNSNEFAFID